jgi:hypothetical protein
MASSQDSTPSIRGEYERHGAEKFYEQFGSDYRNPHEPIIARSLKLAHRDWSLDLSNVLVLAAGSGEVTLVLRELGAGIIDGIDPFTHEAYERRTGQPAQRLSFSDIAAGALEGRSYSLIVASFALHLCEPSRLPRLMQQLSRASNTLLVLTPHKRPQIRKEWRWELRDEKIIERVRSRLYVAA